MKVFEVAFRPEVGEQDPETDDAKQAINPRRQIRQLQVPDQTGKFGAMMAVELLNDGPVTFWLDSTQNKAFAQKS